MADATAEVVTRGTRQFQGAFSEMFFATATIDIGSLADAVGETNLVDVPGVVLGDMVLGVSFGVDLVGITVTAYVSAANVVALRCQNESGAAPNPAATTLKVLVGRPAW